MIKEAVGFGNTVDEAKEDAMLALGAAADADIQIEILEMPKKKVLGVFGGSRAKVRVFIELPDKKEKTQPKNQKENKKKEKTQQKPEQKKPEQKKPEHKKAAEKPAEPEYGPAVDGDKIPADSKAGRAVAYLKSVLKGLGYSDVEIKVAEKENGALISLQGENLGVVIGRRGETLEALQVLVSLAANKGGGFYRVSINIGDYREKREQALVALAEKIADQVLSTGRNRVLEPMSPYERRIIHTAVQEIEGVTSDSVGEGEDRRVVIHAEGKHFDAERSARRPRGRGRERRPSNTVKAVPTREPMRDSDIPLYGKIEK